MSGAAAIPSAFTYISSPCQTKLWDGHRPSLVDGALLQFCETIHSLQDGLPPVSSPCEAAAERSFCAREKKHSMTPMTPSTARLEITTTSCFYPGSYSNARLATLLPPWSQDPFEAYLADVRRTVCDSQTDAADCNRAMEELESRVLLLYRAAQSLLASVEDSQLTARDTAAPHTRNAPANASYSHGFLTVTSEHSLPTQTSLGALRPTEFGQGVVDVDKQLPYSFTRHRRCSTRRHAPDGKVRLNQYTFVSRLGAGVTALVSLYEDKFGRRVAVKSIPTPKKPTAWKMLRRLRSSDESMTGQVVPCCAAGADQPEKDEEKALVPLCTVTGKSSEPNPSATAPFKRSQSGSDGSSDLRQAVHTRPDPTELSAAEREIRLLRRFDHPNVVRLLEVIDDEDDGLTHLFLEYIDGGPIAKVYVDADGGKECDVVRPMSKLVSYMQQLLAGIAHIHKRRVVHNDIKPDNILCTNDGRVVLTDFGESVLMPRIFLNDPNDSHRRRGRYSVPQYHTQDSTSGDVPSFFCEPSTGRMPSNSNNSTDSFCSNVSMFLHSPKVTEGKQPNRKIAGTPAFAAPELIDHSEYDFATDAWSVGVLLYGLLFGCLPFTGPSVPALFEAILSAPLQFPALTAIPDSGGMTPREYDGWVALCTGLLDRDPKRRMYISELQRHPLLAGGNALPGIPLPPGTALPDDEKFSLPAVTSIDHAGSVPADANGAPPLKAAPGEPLLLFPFAPSVNGEEAAVPPEPPGILSLPDPSTARSTIDSRASGSGRPSGSPQCHHASRGSGLSRSPFHSGLPLDSASEAETIAFSRFFAALRVKASHPSILNGVSSPLEPPMSCWPPSSTPQGAEGSGSSTGRRLPYSLANTYETPTSSQDAATLQSLPLTTDLRVSLPPVRDSRSSSTSRRGRDGPLPQKTPYSIGQCP